MLQCNNLAQCQPLITEVSEQHRAQFTHKWQALASRGIWTILPQSAAEFCELARQIWQNSPRKTVGPSYQRSQTSVKNIAATWRIKRT